MQRFWFVATVVLVLAFVLADQASAQRGRAITGVRSAGVGGVRTVGVVGRGYAIRGVGTRYAGRYPLTAGGAITWWWGGAGALYGVFPPAGCAVWNDYNLVNTCTGPYAYRFWW